MRLTEKLNTPKASVATLVLVLLPAASFSISIGLRSTEILVTDTLPVAPILEDTQPPFSGSRGDTRPQPAASHRAAPPLCLSLKKRQVSGVEPLRALQCCQGLSGIRLLRRALREVPVSDIEGATAATSSRATPAPSALMSMWYFLMLLLQTSRVS